MSDHESVNLRSLMERDEQTAKAKERFLNRVRNAPDLGTRDVIRWSRDEMHER
ncbi:MAG: hypothetical protein ABSE42_06540 [Bryobacteraceae bacterium]|jgi:hypothetical protein